MYFGNVDTNVGEVPLESILHELKGYFPEGFNAGTATAFLKRRFGYVKWAGAGTNKSIYGKLVELGLVEKEIFSSCPP